MLEKLEKIQLIKKNETLLFENLPNPTGRDLLSEQEDQTDEKMPLL
jgi:hypothetical protein